MKKGMSIPDITSQIPKISSNNLKNLAVWLYRYHQISDGEHVYIYETTKGIHQLIETGKLQAFFPELKTVRQEQVGGDDEYDPYEFAVCISIESHFQPILNSLKITESFLHDVYFYFGGMGTKAVIVNQLSIDPKDFELYKSVYEFICKQIGFRETNLETSWLEADKIFWKLLQLLQLGNIPNLSDE